MDENQHSDVSISGSNDEQIVIGHTSGMCNDIDDDDSIRKLGNITFFKYISCGL